MNEQGFKFRFSKWMSPPCPKRGGREGTWNGGQHQAYRTSNSLKLWSGPLTCCHLGSHSDLSRDGQRKRQLQTWTSHEETALRSSRGHGAGGQMGCAGVGRRNHAWVCDDNRIQGRWLCTNMARDTQIAGL